MIYFGQDFDLLPKHGQPDGIVCLDRLKHSSGVLATYLQ